MLARVCALPQCQHLEFEAFCVQAVPILITEAQGIGGLAIAD